jgi:hypothetical protein
MDGKNWLKASIVDPAYPSDAWHPQKCRAEVGNYAEQGIHESTDTWYGFRVYLPADFRVDRGEGEWATGCSLIQLKEGHQWNGGLRVDVNDQELRIFWRWYDYSTSQWEYMFRDFPMIRGRAFTVLFHDVVSEQGLFEAWADGRKVLTYQGDNRLSPQAPAGRVNRYSQLGIYCGYRQNVKTAYYTDVYEGTDRSIVEAKLNET